MRQHHTLVSQASPGVVGWAVSEPKRREGHLMGISGVVRSVGLQSPPSCAYVCSDFVIVLMPLSTYTVVQQHSCSAMLAFPLVAQLLR